MRVSICPVVGFLLALAPAWPAAAPVTRSQALVTRRPAAEGASSASSSSSLLRRPVLGYAIDAASVTLRAIAGVPGAALFSDPLALPDGVTKVRVAPGGACALVERDAASPMTLMPLSNGAAGALLAIQGAASAADLAAFSPRGRAAVIYSKAGGRLQAIGGLPNAPAVLLEASDRFAAGGIHGVAVDDAGDAFLAATADGKVYLFEQNGAPQPVFQAGEVSAMAFLPDSSQAAVYDRTSGTLSLLTLRPVASSRTIVSGLTGLAGDIFLRGSADARAVLLAGTASAQIRSIDIAAGTVQAFASPVVPRSFDALSNPDVFLISFSPDQPAWIFAGREGKAYFVPAANPNANGYRARWRRE